MKYIALSKLAADAVEVVGTTATRVNAPDLQAVAAAIASDGEAVCVVAEVGSIDDSLVRTINTAQRISRRPVGIIPFASEHLARLAALMRPWPGSRPDAATHVVYSVDNDSVSSLKKYDGAAGSLKLIDSADTKGLYHQLLKGGTSFSAQLNGRQTFCFLDSSACLHPDLFDHFAQIDGVLTPLKCPIDHFLVQSCHSPFRWPDFGKQYLSVPMGFLLLGNASTFITSTRVQSLVPDLLPLYLSCANAGMTAGEIVRELNAHSRALRIDEDPFVLFGNPQSKIVNRALVESLHSQPLDPPSLDRYRSHLYALSRLLQNLRFSRDQILGLPPTGLLLDADVRSLVGNVNQHLRAIEKDGSASDQEKMFQSKASASAKQLQNTLKNFDRKDKDFCEQLHTASRAFTAQTLRFRSLAAIDATPSLSADLESFATALLRTGRAASLGGLSEALLALWKQKQGYYYFFTDRLESLFLPQSPYYTSYRCPSCSSNLLCKPQQYVGLYPTETYDSRQQLVCPRCLMVRDTSALHASTIEGRFASANDEIQIEITHRNQSRNPEWIFASFHLNDPNNVSANLARQTFSRLLEGVAASSIGMEPRTVAPGEEWRGVISVKGVPDKIFYLLIECHLFIDGCWNWLSFTRRAAHLDEWLKSEQYRGTVPQAQR